MNINYKQSQFELFPGSPGSSDETKKPRYLYSHLTLSLENLVVTTIVALIVLIFFYSLGVEKGKRVAQNNADPSTAVTVNARSTVDQRSSPGEVAVEVTPDARVVITEAVAQPAEMAPKSAPAQEVAENASSKYTIQVASFRKEKQANMEAASLKKKGYEILVVPKGDYSIVCVGKFSNKDEAKSFSSKLKHQYKDFLIRRL